MQKLLTIFSAKNNTAKKKKKKKDFVSSVRLYKSLTNDVDKDTFFSLYEKGGLPYHLQ